MGDFTGARRSVSGADQASVSSSDEYGVNRVVFDDYKEELAFLEQDYFEHNIKPTKPPRIVLATSRIAVIEGILTDANVLHKYNVLVKVFELWRDIDGRVEWWHEKELPPTPTGTLASGGGSSRHSRLRDISQGGSIPSSSSQAAEPAAKQRRVSHPLRDQPRDHGVESRVSSLETLPAAVEEGGPRQADGRQQRGDLVKAMKCLIYLSQIKAVTDRHRNIAGACQALDNIRQIVASITDSEDEEASPGSDRIIVPDDELAFGTAWVANQSGFQRVRQTTMFIEQREPLRPIYLFILLVVALGTLL